MSFNYIEKNCFCLNLLLDAALLLFECKHAISFPISAFNYDVII